MGFAFEGGDQHGQYEDCGERRSVRDGPHRIGHKVRERPQSETLVTTVVHQNSLRAGAHGLTCSTGSRRQHSGKVSPEQRQEYPVSATYFSSVSSHVSFSTNIIEAYRTFIFVFLLSP